MTTDRPARLNEFDKDEWFHIARICRPDLTRDEFDRQWAEFATMKQRKGLH